MGIFYSFLEGIWKFLKSEIWKAVCIPILLIIVIFVMVKHPTIIYEDETIVNLLYRFIGSFSAVLLMLYLSTFIAKVKSVQRISKYGMLSFGNVLHSFVINTLFHFLMFEGIGIVLFVFEVYDINWMFIVCNNIIEEMVDNRFVFIW